MQSIKETIGEIIGGMEYEDEFYTQLLEKMVVVDQEHVDVYLNLLPFAWKFAISKVAPGADSTERNISDAPVPEWNISDASVPPAAWEHRT